jgi:catechol 2,3-dioxygenase-like lactoylglutathione lyase family enzyme
MILALDHVNIITADLDGSARFYAQVLGWSGATGRRR